MIKLFKPIFSLTLLTLSNATALAQQTQWFETDGGKIRVVMEPITAGDKDVRGVIEIDLLPEWITYWRDPGTGGIPPTIQLADQVNYTVENIWFPVPVTINSDYGDHAGYDQPVQIPFSITAHQPLIAGEIDAQILVGVCNEICIPAFNSYKLPISIATGSTSAKLQVESGFARLPKLPSHLGLEVIAAVKASQVVTVEIKGKHENFELFVSGKNAEQFNLPVLVDETADRITYEISPIRPFSDGTSVDFFMAGRTSTGTFETSQKIIFTAK